MTIKFSEQFHVNPEKLEKLDVLDIILDVDTKLFLDPSLLPDTIVPEFKKSKEIVSGYFRDLISLLSVSKKEKDHYWTKADKKLQFKEYPGTCLGYSRNGTQGNSIGKKLRHDILTIIKELIDHGRKDPRLLTLIGAFGDQVGCDRVSDLLIHVLYSEILAFTDRVTRSLKIDNCVIKHEKKDFASCLNPYNNKPILLLPKSCLTPLPLSEDLSQIENACMTNEQARNDLNKLCGIGEQINKQIIKEAILQSENVYEVLLSLGNKRYDFKSDPMGVIRWLDNAQQLVDEVPFDCNCSNPSIFEIANFLSHYFKQCIEVHNAGKLLRNNQGKPCREEYAQLLFFAIANLYCKQFNLDLSRETNNGRGPLDFKFSRGNDKVIIETKLSTNTKLIQGIKTQLRIYMEQEDCTKAIYLVINFGQGKQIDKLLEFYNTLSKEQQHKIKLIIIDATEKESASKA